MNIQCKKWLDDFAKQWTAITEKRDDLIYELARVLSEAGKIFPGKYYTQGNIGIRADDIVEGSLEIDLDRKTIFILWQTDCRGCTYSYTATVPFKAIYDTKKWLDEVRLEKEKDEEQKKQNELKEKRWEMEQAQKKYLRLKEECGE